MHRRISRNLIIAAAMVATASMAQGLMAQCPNGNCAGNSFPQYEVFQPFQPFQSFSQSFPSTPQFQFPQAQIQAQVQTPVNVQIQLPLQNSAFVDTTEMASTFPYNANMAPVAAPPVGYDGYCAVCIVNAGKWVKGSPEFASQFDGKLWYFPSQAEKDIFDKSPEKFVPALNGDCIVCYEKAGKRIAGSVQYSAIHEGRLYLFPSEKEKKVFVDNPVAYKDSDLALDGLCAVCLVDAQKSVKGKTEFTAIHNGLRYLFPSDEVRQTFVTNPAKYISAKTPNSSENKEAANGSSKRESANGSQTSTSVYASGSMVSITGKAGCAACQFGKHPTKSPDELGLAVAAESGTIYIVEEAHTLYPKIYEDRFQGENLAVSGTVLKQDGKFVWVQPKNLNVVNN